MEYNEIKHLLEKYLEGETSLEQEEQLRQYFLNNDAIAEEFDYAKQLFTHLHKVSEQKMIQPIKIQEKSIIQRRLWPIIGVAASVLLGIMLVLFYPKQPEIVYGYKNGQPITKHAAMVEAQNAIKLVQINMHRGTKDLKYLSKFNETQKLITNTKRYENN